MESSKDLTNRIKIRRDSSIEEYVSELLKSDYVKEKLQELHLDSSYVRKYFSLFEDYNNAKTACNNCKGMDSCPLDPRYYSSDLYLDYDNVLSRTLEMCPLLARKEAIRNNYVYHDFDDEDFDLNLNRLPNTKKLTGYSKIIIGTFKNKVDGKNWAYFYGDNDMNKTDVIIANINELAKKGKKVAFINCNTRFNEFKSLSIKDKDEFSKEMNLIALTDVVVLNEFGNEHKSDYVRDQIIMPLLNYRAKKNKSTIFVSDYSLEEIEALYDFSRSAGVVAKKMVSLIKAKIIKETKMEKGIEDYLR